MIITIFFLIYPSVGFFLIIIFWNSKSRDGQPTHKLIRSDAIDSLYYTIFRSRTLTCTYLKPQGVYNIIHQIVKMFT